MKSEKPTIEFKIVGSDFTRVMDCLEKCTIKLSSIKDPSKVFKPDKLFCYKPNNQKPIYNSYSSGEICRQILVDRLDEMVNDVELYNAKLAELKKVGQEIESLNKEIENSIKPEEKDIADLNEQKEQQQNKQEELGKIKQKLESYGVNLQKESMMLDIRGVIDIIDELTPNDTNEAFLDEYYIEPFMEELKSIIKTKQNAFNEDIIDYYNNIIEKRKNELKSSLKEYNNKEYNIKEYKNKEYKNKEYKIKEYKIKKYKNKEYNIKKYKIKEYKNKDILKYISNIISIPEKDLPKDIKEIKDINNYIIGKMEKYINRLPIFSVSDLEKEKSILDRISFEEAGFDKTKIIKEIQNQLDNNPIIKIYEYFSYDITEKNLFDDSGSLIVGHREYGKLSKRDCKLFIKNGNSFGNLVGSIRKTYSKEDFKKIFDLSNCLNESFSDDYDVVVSAEIYSRFDSDPKKPYFLLEMLTQGNLVFNDFAIQSDETESMYSCLLLSVLKSCLLRAYQKGIYRAYKSFDENGLKPKGVINFNQMIKNTMGQDNGLISYSYREKTADNYLNHLILAAYEKLKRDYHLLVINNLDGDRNVKSVLDILKNETHFPKYNIRFLIKKNETPISHPFYIEYEELRKTCVKILKNEGASLVPDEGEEFSGILYYVPDLWEEYLEGVLSERLQLEAQKEVMYFGDKNDEYKSKSYPDFVFYNHKNDPYMILDAKYRPGWKKIHNTSRISKYYKEDYNKCIRDMNSINGYATGVIFPCCRDVRDEVISDNSNYDNELDDENLFDKNDGDFGESVLINDNEPDKILRHKISEYNNITSFFTIPVNVNSVMQGEGFDHWQEEFRKDLNEQIDSLSDYMEVEQRKYSVLTELHEGIEESYDENWIPIRSSE